MLKMTFKKYLADHLQSLGGGLRNIKNIQCNGGRESYHMKKKKPVTSAGYLSAKLAGFASL
jgi:ribosomal protein L37E